MRTTLRQRPSEGFRGVAPNESPGGHEWTRRKGINAGADFVLFKVGSVAGVIEYADIGQPDPSQLQAFVTEAVNKVEGKPTVTPTTF